MDTEAPTTETLSTTIDTDPGPSAAGAGTPTLAEVTEKAEPVSLRDDIKAAMQETEAEPEKKGEEKPDAEAKDDKAAKKDDGKPEEVKAEKVETEKPDAEKPKGADDGKASSRKEDGDHPKIDPPRNFLPDAREKWNNTPRPVQRDIEAMVREHEATVENHRKATERYETLRPYDELARSNGRDLRESLQKVFEIEDALASNPIAGLNKILMEAGPRKADGQPFSLYEVAEFVMKQGPQGYQQMVSRQTNPNAEMQQLQAENERLRAQAEIAKVQMTVAPMVERFFSDNKAGPELQEMVARVLKSDMVPLSLSLPDRLAAAYDMAVRLVPASHEAPTNEAGPDSGRRADDDFSGSKSIKSSPGSVTEQVEDQAKGGESIRDSILKSAKRLSA